MKTLLVTILCALALGFNILDTAVARDLKDIKNEGVLRHLGVPYANFVIGSDQGLDIELIKLFSAEIGVRYEYVPTTWKNVFGDLTGLQVIVNGDNVKMADAVPIHGDVIASGLTVLPWRQKIVDFSTATFPTQVWLVAAARSDLHPIEPSGNLQKDIATVKGLMSGKTVLGVAATCLDPKLYNLDEVHAVSKIFGGSLNELAPAILKGEAEAALLDVPDSLVALAKWPGEVKILGPVSEQQEMAVGFRKDSPELLEAFNRFYKKIWIDGTYAELVKKYYPDVFYYYPDFFSTKGKAETK